MIEVMTLALTLFGFWLYIAIGAFVMHNACCPIDPKYKKIYCFLFWPMVLFLAPFVALYDSLKNKA